MVEPSKQEAEKKDAPHGEAPHEEEEKEVIIKKNVWIKNTSPHLSKLDSWETEKLTAPLELRKGLAEMGFLRPSRIQAAAIPLIFENPKQHLIAQSKNGSGKTGAFIIGSLMRVDPSVKGLQVLVLAHTRELVT